MRSVCPLWIPLAGAVKVKPVSDWAPVGLLRGRTVKGPHAADVLSLGPTKNEVLYLVA